MKKKILYFCNVDWFFISHRLPIGLAAIDEGYEVHLSTKFTGAEDDLISYGFKIHPIEIDRNFNLIKTIKSFFQIVFLIRTIKPQIIHAITIKPIIFAGVASKFFRNVGFVSSISGLGYVFISSDLKALLTKFLVKLVYKFVFSKEKLKVIFQNSDDLNVIQEICKIQKSKFLLIRGSGVDLHFYKPKKKNSNSQKILFASRLLKSKGLFEFIEAAKELNSKKVKFLVAGILDKDNPDFVSQEQINDWESLGLIKFFGYIKNMKDLICDSSIVVLPSYYGEGLPKILIEAAACGKPVVTTDHQGCRDAIIPDKTGILVPIKDSSALTRAIKKLINSPKLCEQMGKEGRKLAISDFDIQNVIEKHLEIYSELIKS